MITERLRVQTNGIELDVGFAGPASGRPVVLLHGFPETGRCWRHQVPVLAAAGWRVIVPDQRGYARSDKPEGTEAYDIDASIDGGGPTGQAGALRLGIARALIELDPELRPTLKRDGFLTRDAREKESKKYGLKKARKAPQFTKR